MAGGCCCCADDVDDDTSPYSSYRPFEPSDIPAALQPSSDFAVSAIGLDDFELLTVLGKGSYGKVLQVRKKDSGQLYAMKVMRKEDILKRNQVRHALTERHLLQTVRHPFIVALHYAFQTEQSLHLVLELQSGGEVGARPGV